MIEFRELIGKKISKLFFVVFPPWGEEKLSNIDISFGFIFKDESNRLCNISVNKDELWSPHISHQPIPLNSYIWEDFYKRMKIWEEAEDNTELIFDFEYYELTNCKLFEKIIDNEIIGVELFYIDTIPEPFGIKIVFEDDYIISIPNIDGNTVQTKIFNKNAILDNFKKIGNVICSKI